VHANALLGTFDKNGLDSERGLWYLEQMATRGRIDEGYFANKWSMNYFMKRWMYKVMLKR
jgi:hypothetical protein